MSTINKENFRELSNSANDVLNQYEVAELLRLPKKHSYMQVQKLARMGKLKGVKVGREWRFLRQSVYDLMHMAS
jgi:excisionase family DNA binding protein